MLHYVRLLAQVTIFRSAISPVPARVLGMRSLSGASKPLLMLRIALPPLRRPRWGPCSFQVAGLQVGSQTCRSRIFLEPPRRYPGPLKHSGVRYGTQAPLGQLGRLPVEAQSRLTPQLPADARERHKPPSKGAALEPKWLHAYVCLSRSQLSLSLSLSLSRSLSLLSLSLSLFPCAV